MGGRAADALDGLASSLRDRLDAVAEAHALSTQARLSAVVVGAAPLGYLAFAALVDAGSVTALVGTGRRSGLPGRRASRSKALAACVDAPHRRSEPA